MKIKAASKVLGLTLATITSVSMTACSTTPLTTQTNVNAIQVQEETQTVIQDQNETGNPSETTTPQEVKRAIEGSVAERFEGADFIEAISAERYVVLYRNSNHVEAEVSVYDITTDSVIKTFTIKSEDWFVKPIIFMDNGFGFISERSGIKNHGVDASFYDLDGNLVNKFSKDFDSSLMATYALASDGSALYVSLNDDLICACGYSFKADSTTKIYAVYGDGSEDLIKEFDAHTVLGLLGTTPDGRLVVRFQYDPNDKQVYTHEEYERMFMNSLNDPNRAKVERGFAFLGTEPGTDPELDRFYETDECFEEVYLRGDSLILAKNDAIIKLSPDANGTYTETKYATSIGAEGYSFDIYVSASGDYVVYPQYTDEFMDTTVNVLKIENGNAELVYSEFFEGQKIEFRAQYDLSVLDEGNGDLFGFYNETAPDGARNLVFYANIFE